MGQGYKQEISEWDQIVFDKPSISPKATVTQVLNLQPQKQRAQTEQTVSATDRIILRQLKELPSEISKLQKTIELLIDKDTKVISDKIYSLPSDEWELINPISFIIKITSEEVLAVIPDLELYSEGRDEIEAVNNLKLEILDLLDDLDEIPETELGDGPKSWKKSLNLLVKRCQ